MTTSWSALADRVAALSAGLVAAGIRPGDRIGLLVPPSADLTAAVYAVWRAGAVIVVADKGLGFAGMRRALRGAAVDHVIAGGAGLPAARLMRLPGSLIAAGRRGAGATHDLAELESLGRSFHDPGRVTAARTTTARCCSPPARPARPRASSTPSGRCWPSSPWSARRTGWGRRTGSSPRSRPFALLGPALGVGSAVPDIDVTAPGTLTAAKLADAGRGPSTPRSCSPPRPRCAGSRRPPGS